MIHYLNAVFSQEGRIYFLKILKLYIEMFMSTIYPTFIFMNITL